MQERNSYSDDSGLFADKGQAKPTRDFVPRLKTDEPAQLEATAQTGGALPEAKPLPDADSLMGGLIRRRTEPKQAVSPPDQAAAEAARQVEREAAEITRTVSEHIDNGMLYESLKMGLPLPNLGKALTNAEVPGQEPKSFGEAALERVARPTTREPNGTVPPAHAGKAGSKTKRANKAHRNPNRRQLTARLSIRDFERFKNYAEESGRTYQDILSTATTGYLDEVTGGSAPPAAATTPPEPAADQAPAESPDSAPPTADPIAVKSPYDWFRRG